jgi:hypothetical protein
MDAADLVVRQPVGVEVNLGPGLDLGLDLGLPLVLDGGWRSQDRAQNHGRGRSSGQDGLEGASPGNPLPALRGDDDRPAVLDDPGRCAHTLDGLVDVEVEGPAGVRGHDDVKEAVDGDHGRLADEVAAASVRFPPAAGEDAGDLLGRAQGDV